MYEILLISHKDNPNVVVNGLDDSHIKYLLSLPNYYSTGDGIERLLYIKSQIETVHQFRFSKAESSRYVFPIRFDQIDSKLRNFATPDEINNFSFYIPDHVLHDVKNNKCKIIVDYSHETYDVVKFNLIRSTTDTVIKNTIKKYNLSPTELILLTGNPISYTDIKDYHVAIREPGYIIVPRDNTFITTQTSRINNLFIRKYKLITLVRKARRHRLRLLEYIFFNNLKKDNLVTCSTFSKFLDDVDSVFDQEFIKSLPWTYDLTNNSSYADFTMLSSTEELLYLESYVNLSAETSFYVPHKDGIKYEVDISEKTYKPIATMQPFIVLGQPGILEYLKESGYKTFDRWWDESYDQIADYNIRTRAVCKLYKKISSMSREDLALMMREMLPVLEHNQQVYREKYHNFSHRHLLDTLDKCFDK